MIANKNEAINKQNQDLDEELMPNKNKTIFIDRILQLSHQSGEFTHTEVVGECKTIIAAVSLF